MLNDVVVNIFEVPSFIDEVKKLGCALGVASFFHAYRSQNELVLFVVCKAQEV